MDLPNKKYSIIYADPPWDYKDKRDTHPRLCGGATVHYNTMPIEELKSLPVHAIADDDCILFIWATFPNLPLVFDVITAWGFVYKTLGFSWIKTNKNNGKPFFGIGHYTKSNCEVCLIAIKGRPKIVSNYVSSVIISHRGEHSKKPDAVRNKIVELCGNIPRIELFARDKKEGWDCWGNEAPANEVIKGSPFWESGWV